MKKLILVLLATISITVALAQTTKPLLSFGIGPTAMIPVGELAEKYNYGAGGMGEIVLHPIKAISISIVGGYLMYFGNQDIHNTLIQMPVLGSIRYHASNVLYGGVEYGYSYYEENLPRRITYNTLFGGKYKKFSLDVRYMRAVYNKEAQDAVTFTLSFHL